MRSVLQANYRRQRGDAAVTAAVTATATTPFQQGNGHEVRHRQLLHLQLLQFPRSLDFRFRLGAAVVVIIVAGAVAVIIIVATTIIIIIIGTGVDDGNHVDS